MYQLGLFLHVKPMEPIAQTLYLLAREMKVFREEQLSVRIPSQELLTQQPYPSRREAVLIALIESDDSVAVRKVFGHRFDSRLYRARPELYVISGIKHSILGALRHQVAAVDRTTVFANVNNPPQKTIGII